MNLIKKDKLAFIIIIVVALASSFTGCYHKEKSTVKAIYLSPKEGGQLTKEDLDKYPEVLRVTSQKEMKALVTKNTAIWIDKDSVNLVDSDWLSEQAKNKFPIVLVGYNDPIYSFRDKLSCFNIKGPYIDWSKQKLEPGFSVGMFKEQTAEESSVFLKKYDMVPDTKQILSITNILLDGKLPQ
ncbi:hypothetical protein [Clostridium fungisolvens]|uniref:Lipoprotein n=1 Tax=Clostridium fungisolvens TaxID=1604897 RepID=A0A6V8SJJ9_9CLOT|nr:hypothetical protein [Clostridium fungisolvens]GFP75328.1 hypothetical protein bsdtw1_01402 [Clostridium fungisolvens]